MATVLVVDDRPSNREYLLALLDFAKHKTLQASDGAEALAVARQERPDLVITDILMPNLDGCEFVRLLRAEPGLEDTRIIFYSAVYTREETAAIADSCGVSTVLAKPADPKTIFDAVNKELGIGLAIPLADTPERPTIAPLVPPRPDGLGHALDQHLRALETLCLKLAGEREPESLIHTFLDAAVELLTAERVAVCLLSSDENDVRHLGARGIEPDLLRGAAMDPQRLPGSLILAGRAVRLDDGQANDALPAGHPPAGAFLGLPICDTQHRHGWMYALRAPGQPPFSEEEERVALMIAAHLAVGYENLNLYQLVQRHAAQLQIEASARAAADAALRDREQRLVMARQVFDSTAESIMMTDADANIIAANPAFERITGYTEAEVLGHNPRLLRSGRHDAEYFEGMWRLLAETGQWRGEIWNRRKDGDTYPERMSISAVRNEAGEVSAYVSVSTDLSALKAAHHQLDYLAQHDPLTGLANRAQLFDRLQTALSAASQRGDQLALLMCNIDRMQRINDSLGHIAGDAVLREIGRRCAALGGRGDSVARLGSDEFLLLRASCEDTEDVMLLARRLIDAVSRPMRIGADRERWYQHLPARRRHWRRPAQGRRCGAVAHQAVGPQRLPLLQRRDERAGAALPGAGVVAAARARTERTVPALPAAGRLRGRRDRRHGSPAALDQPHAGQRAAMRIHSAGRGHGPDHPARHLGDPRGLPPEQGVAGCRPAARAPGRQRVGPPVPRREPGPGGARGAGGNRAVAQLP
jgi:diguanylate cyclase (GGDEF)-like protein/PAS domain S-box-containing protein